MRGLLGQIRGAKWQIGKFGAYGGFKPRGFGLELRDGHVLGLAVCLQAHGFGLSLVSAGFELIVLGLEVLHGLHQQRRELAVIHLPGVGFGIVAADGHRLRVD